MPFFLPSDRSSGHSVITGVVPPPPCMLVDLERAYIGPSIPAALRFSLNVAKSRSRDLPSSFFLQEQVAYECALGETRTHETDPTSSSSRHVDHLPSHRGRRFGDVCVKGELFSVNKTCQAKYLCKKNPASANGAAGSAAY